MNCGTNRPEGTPQSFHVIGGGLVAVQIYAVVQKQGQLRPVSLLAEDLADPVVFGENGGHNAELVRLRRAIRRSSAGTARQQADQQQINQVRQKYSGKN